MKTIWIAVILLVVVLVSSTGMFIYTSYLYNELQSNMARVREAVEEEDWEKARQESDQLEELWARADATWTPVMDHRQVDRLDESLTRVFQLVRQREQKEVLLELAVASRLARRLKDTEVPNFRNVF